MNKALTIRSEVDQIQDYLVSGKGTLTPALDAYLQRLQIVANWLAASGAQRVVVTKIMQHWPGECSQATAYRMIGDAQEIYKPQAKYEQGFYVDNLIASVQQTRRMAEVAQDFKTMANCDKQMAAIIEKHMGTNEGLPLDKIQPPRLVFTNAPELAGAPLPANWQAQLDALRKRRAVGVVANHPDFEDVEPEADELNNPANEPAPERR